MPELPEVETTRRGLAPYCCGHTIRQLVVRDSRLRWPVPPELPDLLQGQTIETVARRGKYLLLSTPPGALLVHLGMSGSLRLVEKNEPATRHDHIDLDLTGSYSLRYNDPRRFGCFLWQPTGDQHPLLARLGPEPLSDEFTAALLFRASRGRTAPVKNFIMDAKVVVGVGNIYANEALFLAGIHPGRSAGRVSLSRYERLVLAIRQVLAAAIEQGGTTLRDFVGGDGKPGYFAQQLQVYGRTALPCKRCGAALREMRISGRSSVYCVACQR